MADSFNFGNVQVGGHAIFGNQNTMVVGEKLRNVTLHCPDEQRLKELLCQLESAIQAAPQAGPGALTIPDKKHLEEQLLEVVEELEKPPAAQDRGRLRRWLDRLVQMALGAPPIVKTALEVKALLGF